VYPCCEVQEVVIEEKITARRACVFDIDTDLDSLVRSQQIAGTATGIENNIVLGQDVVKVIR